METHAHHLHKAPGKNFRHYFFEFLMLFLAVFCGFIAENYREHVVEREKEKQYMRSMIADLKSDTARISKMVFDNGVSQPRIDSLIHLLRRADRSQYGQTMYYFARVITTITSRFELNDRSFEQMKNSGSLRLIHDASVADSVSNYYSKQVTFKQQEEVQLYRMNSYIDFAGKVFDGGVFQEMLQKFPYKVNEPKGNPQLITNDANLINEYIGRLHYVSAIYTINTSSALGQKDATLRMLDMLQSKYSIE